MSEVSLTKPGRKDPAVPEAAEVKADITSGHRLVMEGWCRCTGLDRQERAELGFVSLRRIQRLEGVRSSVRVGGSCSTKALPAKGRDDRANASLRLNAQAPAKLAEQRQKTFAISFRQGISREGGRTFPPP